MFPHLFPCYPSFPFSPFFSAIFFFKNPSKNYEYKLTVQNTYFYESQKKRKKKGRKKRCDRYVHWYFPWSKNSRPKGCKNSKNNLKTRLFRGGTNNHLNITFWFIETPNTTAEEFFVKPHWKYNFEEIKRTCKIQNKVVDFYERKNIDFQAKNIFFEASREQVFPKNSKKYLRTCKKGWGTQTSSVPQYFEEKYKTTVPENIQPNFFFSIKTNLTGLGSIFTPRSTVLETTTNWTSTKY